MANSTTVKDSTATNITSNITSNPITITVVVIDAKGQPASGARVSITPSDASGTTNNAGEIGFTLGNATQYSVTATADGKTVTVPYYVTKGGATRLVVNPSYIKTVEAQLHPFWFSSGIISISCIGLGIIIALVIIWKLFRRNKK